MEEVIDIDGSVPRLDLGLIWRGLRPSVCEAMAFAFTLNTSMHCWQAHGCPRGAREDAERVPLGYIALPLSLELAPDTPTPRSALVEPPPTAPPAPAPQVWETFGRGPETSG